MNDIPEPPGETGAGTDQLMRYARDLARVYRAERAKRAELFVAHQTTRRILDSIGDGVLVVGRDGVIIDANPASCRLIGANRESLIGVALDTIDRLAPLGDAMRRAYDDDGGERAAEFPLSDHPRRYVEARATSYADEAGRQIGWVWVLRDVTEQRRAAEARREFLAIVSHELRTPLTSILGSADILDLISDPQIDEEQRSLVRAILSNARQLRDSVEQILAFSSIGPEIGSFTAERSDIRAIVGDTVAAARDTAAAAGLDLTWNPPHEPIAMSVDVSLFRRAIDQLVDNAIRFTGSGGHVVVELHSDSVTAMIAVRDTGIGILPADLERIFEPFYRAESFRTAKTRGLGLGLPLARRIIRLHGGTIDVASQSGVGSTFTVRVPLATPSR